jgi:hypothetical protein
MNTISLLLAAQWRSPSLLRFALKVKRAAVHRSRVRDGTRQLAVLATNVGFRRPAAPGSSVV